MQSLRYLGIQLFVREKIDWNRGDLVEGQIQSIIKNFFIHVGSEAWSIFWLAGKGGFGVSREQYEFDTKVLERMLMHVSTSRNGDGIVVLASSAGAIYGANRSEIIDENTSSNPESEYGKSKLMQEILVQKFSKETNCKALIARISTAYGPGADHANGYGLINNICRADIRRNPIDIFVPLETSRNYIFSKDVGELLVEYSSVMFKSEDVISTKNIVSPWTTSIAEILYESSRVFKRRVHSISRIDERRTSYGERFDIKSNVSIGLDRFSYTSLASGIQQTRDSIMLEIQNGSQE